MKNVLKKIVLLLLMILGGQLQAKEKEDSLQIEYPFASLSEEDVRDTVLQNFLFDYCYGQIPSSLRPSWNILPDQGGVIAFDGTEQEWKSFMLALAEVLRERLCFEEFTFAKERFLRKLEKMGALFEKGLAEEISWAHIPEAYILLQEAFERLQLAAMEQGARKACSEESSSCDYSTFYDLRLTEEDKQNIWKLLKKLDSSSVFQLAFKKKLRDELHKLGDKIDPVHPLRFLGYILSNADTKEFLSGIYGSYFKWSSFIDGFGKRMDYEAKQNNLWRYIPGFCDHINVPHLEVEHYMDYYHRHYHQWEKLVIELM